MIKWILDGLEEFGGPRNAGSATWRPATDHAGRRKFNQPQTTSRPRLQHGKKKTAEAVFFLSMEHVTGRSR